MEGVVGNACSSCQESYLPLQNKETSDTKLGKFLHLTNIFLKERMQGQLA